MFQRSTCLLRHGNLLSKPVDPNCFNELLLRVDNVQISCRFVFDGLVFDQLKLKIIQQPKVAVLPICGIPGKALNLLFKALTTET